MAGISRRQLLRAAGLAAVVAACGGRDTPEVMRRETRDTDGLGPDEDPSAPRQPRRPRDDAGDDEAAAERREGSHEPEPAGPQEPQEPEEAAAPTRVEVLCREAWGAADPGDGATAHVVSGLMLHHSAVRLDDDRQAPERMRLHQRHHRSQGWADIAYHLGVDRRGNVYELRSPTLAGETGTPYDPDGWLLVMAEGNYDEQEPTEPMLEAISRVLAWGAATFDVDPADVSTHRHHVPTTRCPGEALYAEVAAGRIATRVREQLGAGGVELASVCGNAAARRIHDIEAGT